MRTIFLLFLAGSWLGWAAIGLAQSPTTAFRQAAEAYQTKNWSEASAQFAALIASHPRAPEGREAWFYLGEARTQLGETDAAVAAYRNFLLLAGEHPHREKARFRLAEQAYLAGAADAVAQCEGFLQAFPGSIWQPETLAYLGQLRLQRGEPQLAERVLETALKRFPDHALADENRLGLASAQMRLGKGEAAERLLEQLVERRNDGTGQRARVLLALHELDGGKRAEARQRLEGVLASKALAEPQAAEARFWLARILTAEQADTAAIQLYQQALAAGLGEPQWSAAVTEWAALQIKSGAAAVAGAELRQLQQTPSAKAWTRAQRELALALEVRLAYEAGSFAEAALAAETYRVSFPSGPSYSQVTEISGRTAYLQGDYPVAAERFEELLRAPGATQAELANYRYQLACQQVASRQFAEALASLRELDRGLLTPEVAWQAERLAGSALEGEGRAEEALSRLSQLARQAAPVGEEAQRHLIRQLLQLANKREDYQMVSQHWPTFQALGPMSLGDLPLVQHVADLAYRHRDWALATDCYRELARADWCVETRAAGWSGLAWTALAEQRPDAARAAFETLIDLPVTEERKAEAYLPLGNLMEDAGEAGEAVRMYQRAIAQSENQSVAELARLKAGCALQAIGTESALLEAYDLFQELAQRELIAAPKDQVAYRLGWIEEELGREADAYQRFVRFLGQHPDSQLFPDVVFRVTTWELQQGKHEQAEGRLALVDFKTLPAELRERLRFLQGQIAAARNLWTEVVAAMEPLASGATDPGLRDKAAYWLAEARFQSGDYPGALKIFEQLLQQEEIHLASRHQAGAELRHIECLVALEDWPGALLASEKSIARRGEPDAYLHERLLLRGRALFALGKLNEALECFGKVAETELTSEFVAEAQWRIGETRLAQEDHAGALAAYQLTLAAGDYPHWQAAALLQAGKCEERLGNRTGALNRYRELLHRFPESEFALQAQRRAAALERRARADELIRR